MMTVRGFSWGDLDGVVRVHNAAALADGQPGRMTVEAFTARWQAFGGRPELNLWVIAGASDEVLAYRRPWHSPGWLQANRRAPTCSGGPGQRVVGAPLGGGGRAMERHA